MLATKLASSYFVALSQVTAILAEVDADGSGEVEFPEVRPLSPKFNSLPASLPWTASQ